MSTYSNRYQALDIAQLDTQEMTIEQIEKELGYSIKIVKKG